MKWKKSILAVVILLLLGGGAYLLLQGEKECEHDFYLSDYVAPTGTENGYNEYTCLKCQETYQETIPTTGEPESPEGFGSESTVRTLDLLSFPAYSSSDSPAVAHLSYEAEILDIDNWKHENCYQFACSASENEPCFRRWELNGDYSEVSGTIYMRQGNSTSYWLEFYAGEQIIFSTPRLTANNTKVEFTFDVTGVEYLTMYGRKEGATAGTWIILDPIQITTAG